MPDTEDDRLIVFEDHFADLGDVPVHERLLGGDDLRFRSVAEGTDTEVIRPKALSFISVLSTCSKASAVILVPVGMRVARHELDGTFQLSRPASFDSILTVGLVRPHSLRGETTPSSLNARIPGRDDGSSEAFVASITRRRPSDSEISFIGVNTFFLQR